jgi:hypothetical protein
VTTEHRYLAVIPRDVPVGCCVLVRKPTRKGAKTPSPKYSSCGSSKTFKHLKAGSYVLYVRAIGPGGVDKSPATYGFKIT